MTQIEFKDRDLRSKDRVISEKHKSLEAAKKKNKYYVTKVKSKNRVISEKSNALAAAMKKTDDLVRLKNQELQEKDRIITEMEERNSKALSAAVNEKKVLQRVISKMRTIHEGEDQTYGNPDVLLENAQYKQQAQDTNRALCEKEDTINSIKLELSRAVKEKVSLQGVIDDLNKTISAKNVQIAEANKPDPRVQEMAKELERTRKLLVEKQEFIDGFNRERTTLFLDLCKQSESMRENQLQASKERCDVCLSRFLFRHSTIDRYGKIYLEREDEREIWRNVMVGSCLCVALLVFLFLFFFLIIG